MTSFISYLVNGPSNEEYTRLIHNIHASIQLYDHTLYPHSHTSTLIPPMYPMLLTNGNMKNYISSLDIQYRSLYISYYDHRTPPVVKF